MAFAQCRSIRTASVLTPRSTSHASNGPGTAPSDFCRNASCSATVSSFVATKPPIDVGVSAEVLRRRVEHHVGAERERLLEVRRREGVVDDDQRADRVRRFGRGGDVDDVERRVRRRLEPDELRPLLEMRGEPGRDLVGVRNVKR